MPRFEVHIPAANPQSLNVTLRVDADNWMAALKTGLHKLGEQGSTVQNVLVEIQDDNSIHITETQSGRVFRIRELSGEEATSAPVKKASPSIPGIIPLSQVVLPTSPQATPAPPIPLSPATPEAQKRTGSWPWLESLTLQGQLERPLGEDAQARAIPLEPSSRLPPRRVPTPLQPQAVVELERPTQPVRGPIGRPAEERKEQKREAEDSLSDVFDRVQDVYNQRNQEAALYFLLDLAMEKIATDSGSVLLANAGTGDLSFAAARGPKAQELLAARAVVPAGLGIVGFCASEGVSVAISDVPKDPRYYPEISERLKYPTQSVLCSPMMTHGRAFGCLQLVNKKGGGGFNENEIAILTYIAHQAALYLNRRI
jgi:hypothetical protein